MIGRVVTVVQARMGSTRLPGKVLLDLGGASVLERLIERIRLSGLYGELVVATTTDPADDPITEVCRKVRVDYLRGHPSDLLHRHFQVAMSFGAAHIVKIPSDCPLVDPAVIDGVIGHYLASRPAVDYSSNLHPESHPDGNDVEIMSLEALELAWREARQSHEREHTTPYLWDQPRRFRIGSVVARGPNRSRTHRYVLDYEEDYSVIRSVFEALHPVDPAFGVDAIVEFLDAHPDVAERNAQYRGVNWYRHHLNALRTVSAANTRSPVREAECTS
jgi:spore coat polysaccharide biosynthesis protein SpsF